jgi:hypothetical protein
VDGRVRKWRAAAKRISSTTRVLTRLTVGQGRFILSICIYTLCADGGRRWASDNRYRQCKFEEARFRAESKAFARLLALADSRGTAMTLGRCRAWWRKMGGKDERVSDVA